MSLTKRHITQKISEKTLLSVEDSSAVLENFLILIKIQTKINKLKLNGFGSFFFKKTPKRIGRNPKTLDSYIIPSLIKLNFKPSQSVKDKLN
jgi:integration host factor subunit alpha